ncbi:MAG: FAD-dependent monooxygenase [Chlorobi bacterium]|nr:FAD-dependent monooxygenase [Chlorobiota bacterium]
MINTCEIALPINLANDSLHHKVIASKLLSISVDSITSLKILKRSIDARSKIILIRLKVEVTFNELAKIEIENRTKYFDVNLNKRVIIVGSGPAGLFCALKLIEYGIKPIIIERGKDVRARRFDLAAINKKGIVNNDSNYCFGEGGAGTYSDGKLYTRSTKRGNVNEILSVLVQHGASQDILIDAHPHIGSNILPKVVNEIRNTIIEYGGEFHFNERVIDFIIDNNIIKGAITNSGNEYIGDFLVLAVGHSSRDIFKLLNDKNILIEPKPFALGVRIEHPQSIIDSVQYHCETRDDLLPPASYSMNAQSNGRGVFSFCMCPGGFIVPSATAKNELVVNGMSLSNRGSKFANSGVVVSVEMNDLIPYKVYGNLSALQFQKEVEEKSDMFGGGLQVAPAQRLMDFIEGKTSTNMPDCSYKPGINSIDLKNVLPNFIHSRLVDGIKQFGKKMKSYLTNEAVILSTESRTSSPVKIPRDKELLNHLVILNLFPCGEGAGYAGGIVSAAIDGVRVAEQINNRKFS